MHFTDTLLPAPWRFIAAFVLAWLLVRAVRRGPWKSLADDGRLNLFLGTTVALLALWLIKTGVKPGLGFHLLGSTIVTLMFGPELALVAIALVTLALTGYGTGGWTALPANVLMLGALPIAVSHAVLRLAEKRLPPNFFIYIFVVAFFGGGLAMAAVGIVSNLLLGVAGAYPWDFLLSDNLPFYLLLAWGEAMTTGMLVTILVVYKPEWVSTFDDARYLRRR